MQMCTRPQFKVGRTIWQEVALCLNIILLILQPRNILHLDTRKELGGEIKNAFVFQGEEFDPDKYLKTLIGDPGRKSSSGKANLTLWNLVVIREQLRRLERWIGVKETEFDEMKKIFRTDWRGPSGVTPGKHCWRNADIICGSWLIDHWALISHDSMVPLIGFSFVPLEKYRFNLISVCLHPLVNCRGLCSSLLVFFFLRLYISSSFFYFLSIFWFTSSTVLPLAQFSLVFLKILNHEA